MKDISTILILFLWLPGISLAEVTIENNGYRGVEVVIHEDVPEDIYLLDTLKVLKEIW